MKGLTQLFRINNENTKTMCGIYFANFAKGSVLGIWQVSETSFWDDYFWEFILMAACDG